MADKIVSWKALADFSKVRREARETKEELQDLSRTQAAVAKETEKSQGRTEDALRRTVRSQKDANSATRERVRVEKEAGSTQREEAEKTSRAVTKAVESEKRSLSGLQKALHSVAESRRAERAQAGRHREVSERVIAAREAENRAMANHERALARLSAAKQRAANLEKTSSDRAIRAAREMERAENASIRASERLATVRAKAATVTSNSASTEAQRARALSDVQSAEHKSAAAADRLAASREAVARASANSSESESRRARAMAAVASSESEVERSSGRLLMARRRLSSETDRDARSSGKLTAAYRGMSSAWGRAKSAADGFSDILLIKMPMAASVIGLLIGAVGSLGAAFMALGGAIGPAIGALATIPTFAGAAITGIMGLVAAFGAIGPALKAYSTMQKNAGKEAKTFADRQAASADQVADAQKRLARVQRDSGRRIEKAQQRLVKVQNSSAEQIAEAQQRLARVQRDATRQVEDAYERAAEAAEAAADRVSDAEENLADAQNDARRAQDYLTQARREAIRELDDLKDAVRDTALSEEGAVIAVEEARRRLAEVNRDDSASDLDRRRADLNYREAVARLDDAKEARAEANEANAKAEKDGINATRAWSSAQEDVARTQRSVADAEESLADARREQAKTAADNAEAIADAQESAAEAVADAQEGLADAHADAAESIAEAQEAVAEAHESAAESIADAQAAVADAMREQAKASAEASASADAYNEAMAKLTPAARSFVLYLISLKDVWKNLQDVASENIFPGLESGMRKMMTSVFPLFLKSFDTTTQRIGDMFANIGTRMTTPDALKNWSQIFESQDAVADSLAGTIEHLSSTFLRLADAAGPLAEWIAQGIEDWAAYTDEATAAAEKNGELDGYFRKVKRTLSLLGAIISNITGTFSNLGDAGEESGYRILETFEEVTAEWEEWSKKVSEDGSLDEYFRNAEEVLYSVGRLIRDISKMIFGGLGSNDEIAPFIDRIRTDLLPLIEELFKTFEDSEIPDLLVDAVAGFLQTLIDMSNSGAFKGAEIFLTFLTDLFKALSSLVKIPGVAPTLAGIAAGLAAIKAVRLVGSVTGISSLTRELKGLYGVGKKISNRKGGWRGLLPFGNADGGGSGKGRGRHRPGNVPVVVSGADGAGKDVGSGLVGGMNSKKKNVTTAAGALGSSIITAIKKVLLIKSPSRVMFNIGVDIAKGIINGINSMKGRVGAAVTGVGSTATTAGKKSAAGASTVVAGGTAGKPAKAAKAPRGGGGGGGGAMMGVGLLLSLIPAEGALGNILSIVGMLLMFLPLLVPVFVALGGAIAAITAPIWIVIGVIALFVGAITLLWKHNEKFRNFVKGAWEGIKNSVIGAWENHIWPALKKFGTFLKDDVGGAVSWLWKNIIGPAFKGIGSIIVGVWRDVIWPTLKALWSFISNTLGPIFSWLWNSVIKPVFGWIGGKIKEFWEKVAHPIFSKLKNFIENTLGPAISDLYGNVVKPIFRKIGDAISGAWERGIKPAFRGIRDGVDTVAKAFDAAKRAIQTAWGKVAEAVSKPVVGTVNWVGENFVTPINKMLEKLGVDLRVPWPGTLKAYKYVGPSDSASRSGRAGSGTTRGAFARGGVLPGYTPGRDVHQFYSPSGGRLDLSGGEAIMRPEWTRALGKRKVDELNKISRTRGVTGVRKAMGFARGGVLQFRNGTSDIGRLEHGVPETTAPPLVEQSWMDKAWGFLSSKVDITKHVGNLVRKLIAPVKNMGGWVGEALYGAGHKLISGLGSKIFSGAGMSGGGAQNSTVNYGGRLGWAPGVPNMSWPLSWAMIHRAAPEARITSTYRPGAITASGYPSLHGLGRAVDIVSPNMAATFRKIRGLRKWSQLFYSPMGNAQIGYRDAIVHRTHFDHIHAAFNRGGIYGFNTGGTVPGSGTGDRVPAMLEPGEFVMRKRAVARVGVHNLRALNGGDGGGRGKGAAGVQHFHSGGLVRGLSTSSSGQWVRWARALMGMGQGWGTSAHAWTSGMTSRFNKLDHSKNISFGGLPSSDLGTTLMLKLRKFLAGYRLKSGDRTPSHATALWAGLKKILGLTGDLHVFRKLAPKANQDRYLRGVPTAVRNALLAHVSRYNSRFTSWGTAAHKALGLSGTGYSTEVNRGLAHAMAHATKRTHDALAPRPWSGGALTAVEQQALATRKSTAFTTEWNGYLDQISRWGLPLVVDKLLEMGPNEDSIIVARSAAKSRTQAAAWEKELEAARTAAETSTAESYKLVAFIQSKTAAGIRDAARELGISDFGVVDLYEKLLKAGRITKGTRTRKMDADIAAFRRGTFYARTGGMVPGTGSGDRVPAMLEPGEFVLRKKAVQALGLETLFDLNNVQKFATGGVVYSPTGNALPSTASITGVAHSRLTRTTHPGATVNNITHIHNPVPERASESVNKMLRRRAATGAFGPNPTIGNSLTVIGSSRG